MLPVHYDEAVYKLIAQSVIQEFPRKSNGVLTESANLLSAAVLKVFCFSEQFIISTFPESGTDGAISNRFDLIQFADIICDGEWTRITIEDLENSWISVLWGSEQKETICDLYSQKGMDIKFERGIFDLGGDGDGGVSESFVVTWK